MMKLKRKTTWILMVVGILFLLSCTAFAQEDGQLISEDRVVTVEDVKLEFDSIVFSQGFTCPKVTIDGLTEGTDYFVDTSGVNNHPGIFELRINGINRYSGSLSVPFLVKRPVPQVILRYEGYVTVNVNSFPYTGTSEIYRSVDDESNYQLFTGGHEDRTVVRGHTYYYKVRTIEEDSRLNSDFTVASITIPLKSPVLTLEHKLDKSDHILSWDKVDGADAYEVWRRVGSGSYKLYQTTTKTSYTDTAITVGKRYYYSVKAISKNNEEANSRLSNLVTDVGRLPTPANVKIKMTPEGLDVLISWDKVPGADYYQIVRTTLEQPEFYTVVDTTSRTHGMDLSAEDNTTYYYMVRACVNQSSENRADWDLCCSEYSPRQKFYVYIPNPWLEYDIDKDTGELTITWGEDESPLYNTEIWRATKKDGTYVKLPMLTKRIYVDYDAMVGKTYYYRFRYVDKNDSSVKSQYVYLEATRNLLPVKSLKATNLTTKGSIKLSWNKGAKADYYIIKRSTKLGGTYKEIGTTSKTAFTDKKATPGQQYYYRVIAVYKENTKANSYWATCKGTWVLAAPKVTLSNKTKKTVKLSWKRVNGASEYQIWRASSKNGKYVRVTTTKNCTYTNKKLTKGKKYYYKVKAIYKGNSKANSAYSAVKSIKAR